MRAITKSAHSFVFVFFPGTVCLVGFSITIQEGKEAGIVWPSVFLLFEQVSREMNYL